MTEQRRSKASEIVDDLMGRPLTPEEAAKREPRLPRLRLRQDVSSSEIDDTTHVKDVIDRLPDERTVALYESGAEPTAIVLPVERYLELVAKGLASRSHGWVTTLDGGLVPEESALAESGVEQVDPSESWRQAE